VSKNNFKKSIEEIRLHKIDKPQSEYRLTKFNDKVLDAISEVYNSHYICNKEIKWPDDETKNTFLDLIIILQQKTKLFVDCTFIFPIAKVVIEKDSWIRSYETWEPKSYNADKQFSSLLRHLFTKYKIPAFLDSLWFKTIEDSSTKNHFWFIYVCSGKNITTCSDFMKYYPMTKKIAHYFMQAPNDFTIKQAYSYGKFISLGATMRLVKALIPTKLAFSFNNDEEFKNSIVKFFIANPMLDYSQIGPIIDYIWNQKYEVQRGGQGRVVQPNFSMTGRTVESLLRQVEHWHKQLTKVKGGKVSWEHSSISDFVLEEGSEKNTKTWVIRELLNSKELIEEGRVMRHCVASYASSCSVGSNFIWSLSLNDEKLLTIEVSKLRRVGQIRGFANRMAAQKEKSIISQWAKKENLIFEKFI
jgi:hypothetical protein